MTNEEIIKGLKAIDEECGKHFNESGAWMQEFLHEAIKALEQEPKIGTWKHIHEHIYLDNGICKEWDNYYCSECDTPNSLPSNFCPQCGQKKEGGGRMTDREYMENKVRHAFNKGYDLGFKYGKEKAKSQEPILDKIRAEITAIAVNGQVDEHTMFVRSGEQVKQMVLDVIDKYKGESEDAE